MKHPIYGTDFPHLLGVRLADINALPPNRQAHALADLDRFYALQHHRHRLAQLMKVKRPTWDIRTLIDQSAEAVANPWGCVGRFDLEDESYMDELDAYFADERLAA